MKKHIKKRIEQARTRANQVGDVPLPAESKQCTHDEFQEPTNRMAALSPNQVSGPRKPNISLPSKPIRIFNLTHSNQINLIDRSRR
jgi:hypothetical protein